VRQTVFTATEIHNAFFFVSRLYNVVGMHWQFWDMLTQPSLIFGSYMEGGGSMR
jgi:hypothetical protein